MENEEGSSFEEFYERMYKVRVLEDFSKCSIFVCIQAVVQHLIWLNPDIQILL